MRYFRLAVSVFNYIPAFPALLDVDLNAVLAGCPVNGNDHQVLGAGCHGSRYLDVYLVNTDEAGRNDSARRNRGLAGDRGYFKVTIQPLRNG